jgi:hypothetical protein
VNDELDAAAEIALLSLSVFKKISPHPLWLMEKLGGSVASHEWKFLL